MKNIYEIYFYGGLIMAILLIITAVVLFIVFKIPRVFGELTGRGARKSIKEKQNGNESKHSAAKKEQAKYYNQGSDKIKVRETVSAKKRGDDNTTDLLDASDYEETALLSDERAEEETDVLLETAADDEVTDILAADAGDDEVTDILAADAGDDEATDILAAGAGDDEATDILTADAGDDEATDILTADGGDSDATDVLQSSDDDEEATTVLTSKKADVLSGKVKVAYNIVLTNTDESL